MSSACSDGKLKTSMKILRIWANARKSGQDGNWRRCEPRLQQYFLQFGCVWKTTKQISNNQNKRTASLLSIHADEMQRSLRTHWVHNKTSRIGWKIRSWRITGKSASWHEKQNHSCHTSEWRRRGEEGRGGNIDVNEGCIANVQLKWSIDERSLLMAQQMVEFENCILWSLQQTNCVFSPPKVLARVRWVWTARNMLIREHVAKSTMVAASRTGQSAAVEHEKCNPSEWPREGTKQSQRFHAPDRWRRDQRVNSKIRWWKLYVITIWMFRRFWQQWRNGARVSHARGKNVGVNAKRQELWSTNQHKSCFIEYVQKKKLRHWNRDCVNFALVHFTAATDILALVAFLLLAPLFL